MGPIGVPPMALIFYPCMMLQIIEAQPHRKTNTIININKVNISPSLILLLHKDTPEGGHNKGTLNQQKHALQNLLVQSLIFLALPYWYIFVQIPNKELLRRGSYLALPT